MVECYMPDSSSGAGRWALGAGRWALGAGRWALSVERLLATVVTFHLSGLLSER